MCNKAVLFIFFIGTSSIGPMNSSDVSRDSTPKKFKKNRVFDVLRAIPFSWFPHKKKKDTSIATQVPQVIFSIESLVKEIATHIYTGSSFQEKCKNIRKFSGINKTTYFFCKKNGYTDKEIIQNLALASRRSDFEIAIFSGHKRMSQEIRDLFNKVQDPCRLFSVTDLQDRWLINATYPAKNEDIISLEHETLLTTVVKNFDIKKTETLLQAGAHYEVIDPIALMVVPHINSFNYLSLDTRKQRDFFSIVGLLLAYGAHPDNRYRVIIPTLLHLAAFNDDKELALVLLERYNADPYKLYIECNAFGSGDIAQLAQQLGENSPEDRYFGDDSQSDKDNAFTLEQGEPQGWLKMMYDEIQRQEALKTTLSPTDQSAGK